MPIKWIFFDVGDVLIDESGYTQWKRELVLRSTRVYVPALAPEDVERVWPLASAQPGSLMQNAVRLLLTKQEDADRAVETIKNSQGEMNEARKKQAVYPEALQVLRALSKAYRLGILANQPIETRQMLKEAGLGDYLSSANVSGDYPFQKPDKRYFLQTLKDASAEPTESILVDDNIERGLVPAKEIGMKTIWFKHKDRMVPDNIIDAMIENLEELEQVLKRV